MEVFGFIAFILAMVNIDNSDKIKKLEKDLAKMKKTNKEAIEMSELLKTIIGQPCTLQRQNGTSIQVKEVLDVDEEWIKYVTLGKKGSFTKLERLELFVCVTLN